MSKQLLFSVTKKDLIVETFRAGGAGGQKQNKTSSGVRIKHPESGCVAESRTYSTQPQNKREAFRRLVKSNKFKQWVQIKAAAMEEGFRNLEHKVDSLMDDTFLKVEFFDPKVGVKQRNLKEKTMCIHGRSAGFMCPHCLGFNGS